MDILNVQSGGLYYKLCTVSWNTPTIQVEGQNVL